MQDLYNIEKRTDLSLSLIYQFRVYPGLILSLYVNALITHVRNIAELIQSEIIYITVYKTIFFIIYSVSTKSFNLNLIYTKATIVNNILSTINYIFCSVVWIIQKIVVL